MSATENTKTVGVLSWHAEGFGGFNWYPPETSAEVLAACYAEEVEAQEGETATVRLVMLEVPADLTGQELTNWIDDGDTLEAVENTAPALFETVTS